MENPSFVPPHENADLIPIRMCNQLVYCERLFHIEYVQGTFTESADTVAGSAEHERGARRGSIRIRRRSHELESEPDEPPWTDVPRTLELASKGWGLRGKMDVLEVDERCAVVVEMKHGRMPPHAEHQWHEYRLAYQAWPGDVAQAGLYMALLREAGVEADEARIYYRGSRRSVTITWSRELEDFVSAVVRRAREVVRLPIAPEPLRDSPKCPGCSLHDTCLPDEHHAVVEAREATRRITVAHDERSVVHVMTPGSTVRKDGAGLEVVSREGEVLRVLTKDVSHLALFGPCQVTTQAVHHLLRAGVGVSYHTTTGTLLGMTHALSTRNIGLRRAQYRAADDAPRCLEIARALVTSKIRNQRTVLRRQLRGQAGHAELEARVDAALERMQISLRAAERCSSIDVVRGHEGEAASQYFGVFKLLLPEPWANEFDGRNRRPPKDRVNAMLSFAYSLLTREAIAAATRVGLDPMLGFFHTMIPGRPALALDVIEPFRPAWSDTAVFRLLATKGIELDDFTAGSEGVYLTDAGRRKLIGAHERRAREETTHPRFGYRMTYRRMVELEIRMLAKVLTGELESFTPMCTR